MLGSRRILEQQGVNPDDWEPAGHTRPGDAVLLVVVIEMTLKSLIHKNLTIRSDVPLKIENVSASPRKYPCRSVRIPRGKQKKRNPVKESKLWVG